ncbi:bifunctional serine/threonine-protein kinase/ABC transporter substrate-binding protein [Streptomyces sp. NPDC059861]|uniref:bifunctional serine/threonine-protein kinase/ABC transporter substrate-binding protein n=1 Tax=Streptomyces sp. NPDC059861 TaxID=3346974 RepID=UPI00364AF6DC
MSEPLLPSDPSRIAAFRLLRRLGAGGMGVVYLGRTDAGKLAAVKVIQADGAADDDFRTRFAREVDLARRVESPWVVPVLDADAEAREPWLATEFVPGPALAEAVAAHGPLPPRAARVLGGRLAEALTSVHAAGLVHRDVKPGNVLLALDGPRLIDFGIARALDDTALTASGVVVGTPGFLAPEQARGEDATAASDVFALGCVLAYAMTGRPPFGTGEPHALLYRTVHDQPELDRVDAGSRSLVARCLAKDPQARPTAEEVRAGLTEDLPDGADWLPDPVARMVALRSSESLALPGIEPTAVDAGSEHADGDQGAQDAPSSRPARRRLLLAGGALLLAAGGAATAAALTGRDDEPEGSGGGRPTYVLGVHSTTDPAAAPLARACERAAHLAVAEHNAARGRAYDLAVRVLRDPGTVAGGRDVAGTFTADRDVVAVLGPVTELAMRTAANIYGDAGLTHVSSTTGQQDYFVLSRRSSFQSGAPHSALGSWIVLHAIMTKQAGRLGAVLDRSGGTAIQEQGSLVVSQWRQTLGGEVVPRVVAEETDDGPAAVRALLAAGIDAFAYLGPLDATVRAAQELAEAGFAGPRWMQHQLYGSQFPSRAGAAGEGWYAVTSAVDAAALTTKRARDFTAAWRRRYHAAPEPHAAEAYDSARMLLTEFARTVPAGARRRPVRAALGERMAKASYQGIARGYAFGNFHEYTSSGRGWSDGTFVHEVRDGRFRQLGSLSDLERASKTTG